MIVALDVAYADDANVAAIAFAGWRDDAPVFEWVTVVSDVAEYEPGAFYKRELPCLLAAFERAASEGVASVTAVIIDGYVWLDARGRQGLGAHLHEALGGEVPVVGIAKNEFAGCDAAVRVLRGESRRPLFVTAAGLDVDFAAECVRSMHGDYRIPTLLQHVDALSRG